MKKIIVLIVIQFTNNINAQTNNTIEQSIAKITNIKINDVRRRLKIDTLIPYVILDSMSMVHGTQMAKYHFFNHTNPYNKDLKTLKERAKYYHYSYLNIAENIAFYETDTSKIINATELANKFVKNWLQSKGHYENLTNPIYKFTFVNVVKSIQNNRVTYYIVQNFSK